MTDVNETIEKLKNTAKEIEKLQEQFDPRVDSLINSWNKFVQEHNHRFDVLAQKLDMLGEAFQQSSISAVQEEHKQRESRHRVLLRDNVAYELFKKVYLRDDEDEDDYDFAAKSAWSAAAAFIENYPTNEVDERCESTCPHGDQCTLPIGHDGGHNHRYCNCNEPNVDTHVEKDRATKSKVRPWTNQLVTVFDSGRYNHLILMLKTSVKWLGPEEWKVLGTLLERILNSIKELDRALNDMEKNDD